MVKVKPRPFNPQNLTPNSNRPKLVGRNLNWGPLPKAKRGKNGNWVEIFG